MPIKAIVDNLDDVPEQYRDLYTERNGKFEVTGVEGMKTQADVDRLNSALSKERTDHKLLRDSVKVLGDRKIEDVVAALDRIPELEALANGKVDDNKINEIVEGRLRAKLAPVERERDQLRGKLGEHEKVIETYTAKERTRAIHDAVRTAAASAKLLNEAMDDALLLAERIFEVDETGRVVTKDGVGVTPGLEASAWLTDLQSKRPHWWGPSFGGGAGGNRAGAGQGSNPFTAENWNMTEQGKLLRENRAKAEQLAKAAGTTVGGPKPAARK